MQIMYEDPQIQFRLGDGIAGMAGLEDESVDATLVDPPYGMMQFADIPKTMQGKTLVSSTYGGGGVVRRNIDFDQQTAEEMGELYEGLFKQAARIVKTGGWVLVWCKAERLHMAEEAGTRHGLRYKHPMVWHKVNPVPRIRVQGPCIAHEVAALFSKGAGKFYGTPPSKCHSVVTHPASPGSTRWHPTQKPQSLMDQMVEWLCPPGGLACDPMAGSGSLLLACRNTGRRGIGWELDDKQASVTALALRGEPKAAHNLALQLGILLSSKKKVEQPSLLEAE